MESLWNSPAELGLWIAVSFALYILVANLLWRAQSARSDWWERWARWRYAPWLQESLRFLYYIGLPYAVIVFRRVGQPAYMGIPPLAGRSLGAAELVLTFLGLAQPDEAWRILWSTLGVTAGVLTLTVLLNWWYTRALRALSPTDHAPLPSPDPSPWWIVFREAVYLQIHWAFYRSGTILLTGDYYSGTVLSLVLIGAEWFLDPAWRADLDQPARAEVLLARWGLALINALLFYLTRMLWVGIVVHWVLAWLYTSLVRWLRRAKRKPAVT